MEIGHGKFYKKKSTHGRWEKYTKALRNDMLTCSVGALY